MISLQANRSTPWSSSAWEYPQCLHLLGQMKWERAFTGSGGICWCQQDTTVHAIFRQPVPTNEVLLTDKTTKRKKPLKVFEGGLTSCARRCFTCCAAAAHLPVVCCVLAVQGVRPQRQQEDRNPRKTERLTGDTGGFT